MLAKRIGLATGKLFFVLDLKDKRICLEDTEQALPDNGYTVYTPSGGKHYYFQWPDSSTVGCIDDLTPEFSVIGTGGYIAVPPSPGYEFAHEGEPPIVCAPPWLRRLIDDETSSYLRKLVKPLLSGDIEPIEYLVRDFVPCGSIGLIAGASGSGKTSLLVSVAVAVSQGLSWCGMATKQTPVVIFDRENSQGTARDMLIRHGLKDESTFSYYGRWNDSRVPDIADILRMPVVSQKPLFVFDSFSRFHKGDENAARDVRDTFDQLRQLADAGCTVLVIHHTGKAEGSHYRGSSDIEAAVDFAYEVSATKSGGYLNTIKLENFKFRNECVQKKTLKVNEAGALEPLAFAEKKASVDDALTQLLADNPGITATEFVTRSGLGRRKVDVWREQNNEFIAIETKGKVKYLTLKPK